MDSFTITVSRDEDGVFNARAVLGERDFAYGYGATVQEAAAEIGVGIDAVLSHERSESAGAAR